MFPPKTKPKQITADDVKKALQVFVSPQRAVASARYFKTAPGKYGAGDLFIGVTVPHQRQVAKAFKHLSLTETIKLLHSEIHEHRLTALFVLIEQFIKSNETTQKKIYTLYLKNTQHINNWDLVDSSAPYIVGQFVINHLEEESILTNLALSSDIWERRIAMLATFPYIRKAKFTVPIKIATTLVHDPEDLIHKAVGWMLREIGKINQATAEKFLQQHASTMPRTMLRYAIEKFSPTKRKKYLSLKHII